jgi:hypothetical protein
MDLNFVLLTKAYDEPDIKYWLQYHHNRFDGARFTIVDNDSIVDVKKIADEILGDYHYIRLNGFPNQRKLYADLMNGAYGKIFKEDEAVAFFDDDEYFYLRDPNDEKNELDYREVLDEAFEIEYRDESLSYRSYSNSKFDTLVIPHINMSTLDIFVDRNPSCPLALTHTEHRNDSEATVKCIVRYSSVNEYEWKIQPRIDEAGHVPFVNGKRNAAMFTAWIDRETEGHPIKVLTFPIGNTSFGTIDYQSNVRLYHYHIKSQWDWDQKIKRGSCACLTPWYSPKLEENCFYGGYDYFDFDMKDEFLRYCEWKLEDYGKGQFHPTWSPFRENATTIRKSQFKLEKEHKVGYEDFRFATTFEDKRVLGRRWLLENAPELNVEDPKTHADLIAWGKLYDMNPKKSVWADKCAVYKELYDLGLEDIRIPILYERYKPADSDIREALELCRTNDCILKCNHASGYNIRFNATEGINYDFLTKKIRGWLDTNYAYIAGYEWQYEAITPAILVQPSLFPRGVKPTDYQFYCENGNIVAVEIQRKASKVIIEHIAFTDIDGNDLDWCLGSWPLQKGLNIEQKEAVAAMRPVVEEIAKLFKFVRVDLFWVNKRIYFCETTFCPCSGVLDYQVRNK